MGDRLNRIAQLKTSIYLRGMEKILTDIYLDQKIFEYILDRIKEFYLEYEERILKHSEGYLDIIATGDDFGTQDNLIMSPDDWIKSFKPGFNQYIEKAHSYNVPVMHHTCGSVFDILQSLQPDTYKMDFKKIKKEFGSNICFQGCIGVQKNLPFGKPEHIEKEVRSVFEAMKENGGYIACTSHNIQSDTSVENIIKLFEAYEEYGNYE